MDKAMKIGFAVAVVVLVAIAYYLYRTQTPAPAVAAATQPEAPPAAPVAATPAEPTVHYPVPSPESEPASTPRPTLPALADSDPLLASAMASLFGQAPVASLLVPQRIVQHLVVAIDSLDRAPAPLRLWPVVHVPGLPVVASEGGLSTLSPDNARRYQPYLAALDAVDGRRIGNLYLRYYPLFQDAYRELGYPDRSFNDRLVQVIDHLLATPEVAGPVALVRPKVLYEFADPELEKWSWGRKALIRMGADNAALVKARLREIRRVIAAGAVAH